MPHREKAGVREEPGKLAICKDDGEAVLIVRLTLGLEGRPSVA